MVVEITEIRIKLMEGSEDRLRAFCSITIDQSFVVRDLKIIDGTNGPFVAMPSRKLTGHCPRCGGKNHLRAGYCNQCGNKQNNSFGDSPQKLYADVAHPINSECREMIQNAVITEFQAELNRAAQPGYRSRYDDDFDAGDYDAADYDDASANVPAEKGPTVSAPSHATAQSVTLNGPHPAKQLAAVKPCTTSQPDEPAMTWNQDFGAGLFDPVPEAVEPSTATGDAVADSADQANDSSRDESDDRLVRVERGMLGKAVPAPHMNDRSREHEVAPVNASDAEAQPSRDDDEDDRSGFGSGIFDD
ncbi:SpoVG family protein [Neorhodopirellula pilleata]|uniref:Putative septation protein SpoVG n=1 Tax=Neorhodopirellula pilleata TaxID=2714738 RepID=A0A5C5ZX45_9BACT|nr:putative septation protein SpoVG [Neorhodopirellula pilleata]